MEVLSILWIGGIIAWFWRTSERDRENHLLWMWGLMALPVLYWLMRLLFL